MFKVYKSLEIKKTRIKLKYLTKDSLERERKKNIKVYMCL